MRLRKVKDAELIIHSSNYIINVPEEKKGEWQKEFNNDNPIYIEIGMGKGQFIIENAKKYPKINFIGIEMFDSVMVRAVQSLEDSNLPNLKLIKMNARLINDVFDKEIDRIYLNFSDPWPKKRTAKRRLSSHTFLKYYDNVFKGKKEIIMKTDNKGLFGFSLESFSTYGYTLEEVTLDLYNSAYLEDNIATEYETKFHNKGVTINRVVCKKEIK